MGQVTTDNIVTFADETIPLSEINDSDLVLLADSEGNFKKTTIEEIVSKCYNDNILGKEKANVPLETSYVQLSNMPTPDTLYLGTWEDVSADYDGAYLRVLGTDSGDFGTLQAEGLPNISGKMGTVVTGSGYDSFNEGAFYWVRNTTTTDSTWGNSGGNRTIYGFDASRSNAIYGANEHVTPKAHAIKIWKRTA